MPIAWTRHFWRPHSLITTSCVFSSSTLSSPFYSLIPLGHHSTELTLFHCLSVPWSPINLLIQLESVVCDNNHLFAQALHSLGPFLSVGLYWHTLTLLNPNTLPTLHLCWVAEHRGEKFTAMPTSYTLCFWPQTSSGHSACPVILLCFSFRFTAPLSRWVFHISSLLQSSTPPVCSPLLANSLAPYFAKKIDAIIWKVFVFSPSTLPRFLQLYSSHCLPFLQWMASSLIPSQPLFLFSRLQSLHSLQDFAPKSSSFLHYPTAFLHQIVPFSR